MVAASLTHSWTLRRQGWAVVNVLLPSSSSPLSLSTSPLHRPPESWWQGCCGNYSRGSDAANDHRTEMPLPDEDEQMSVIDIYHRCRHCHCCRFCHRHQCCYDLCCQATKSMVFVMGPLLAMTRATILNEYLPYRPGFSINPAINNMMQIAGM